MNYSLRAQLYASIHLNRPPLQPLTLTSAEVAAQIEMVLKVKRGLDPGVPALAKHSVMSEP